MINIETSAAISPYSINVAADWSRTNLRMICMTAADPNFIVGSVGGGQAAPAPPERVKPRHRSGLQQTCRSCPGRTSGGRRLVDLLEVGGDVVELEREVGADRGHGGDGGNSDQSGDEAVLNGGRAGLVLHE